MKSQEKNQGMKKVLLFLFASVMPLALTARQTYVFDNGAMNAAVDLGDGRLTGLQSNVTGWSVISDPAYGCSLEMSLRFPDGKREL